MNNQEYELLKRELNNINLETERLIIREFEDTDEDGFLAIFQDEQTMAMDDDAVIIEKNDEFYRRMALIKNKTLLFLSLSEKNTDNFIGYVLLNKFPEDQSATISLGCSLIPKYQSMGYGYEALKCILYQLRNSNAVTRVLASAFHSNIPSLGLIRKLGFTYNESDEKHDYFFMLLT